MKKAERGDREGKGEAGEKNLPTHLLLSTIAPPDKKELLLL